MTDSAKVAPDATPDVPQVKEMIFNDKEQYRRAFVFVALKTNSMYGYPGTNGTRKGNFFKFFLQSHPVVSIFGANKLHPFGKCERFTIICIQLTFQFFFAKILNSLATGECKTCEVADPGESSFYESYCGEDADVCRDDVDDEYGEYNYYCSDNCHACGDCEYDQDIGMRIVGILISSLTSILIFALKFAATCGFVQNCHPCIRCCFEKLGSCFICVMVLVSIIFLVAAFIIPATSSTFAADWIMAVAISWLQWPMYSIPLYLWKFDKKKKKFQDKYPGFDTIKFDPNYVPTEEPAPVETTVEDPMPVENIELTNIDNPLNSTQNTNDTPQMMNSFGAPPK